MAFNFNDFYVLYPGHPDYSSSELMEDDVSKVIIQKYHMLIFTNKGDVMGQLDFGANLQELLHETKFSSTDVERDLKEQISKYIPELDSLEYTLSVNFYPHPDTFEDFMVIDLSFKGFMVSAIIQ